MRYPLFVVGVLFLTSVGLHAAPRPTSPLRSVDTGVVEPDTGVFSPDGRYFYLSSSHGDRTVVDLASMKVRRLIDPELSLMDRIKTVAKERALGLVFAQTLNKKKMRKSVDGVDRTNFAAFSPDGRELLLELQSDEVQIWSIDDGRIVARLRNLASYDNKTTPLRVAVEGAAFTARGAWQMAWVTPRMDSPDWLKTDATFFLLTDVRTGEVVYRIPNRVIVDQMIANGWRGESNVEGADFHRQMALSSDGTKLTVEATYRPNYETPSTEFDVVIDLPTMTVDRPTNLPPSGLSSHTQPGRRIDRAEANVFETAEAKGLVRMFEDQHYAFVFDAPDGRTEIELTDDGILTERPAQPRDEPCDERAFTAIDGPSARS